MCMVCEWHVHNVISMVRKSFPLAGLQFQTGGAEDLPQANNSAQVHRYHRHRYIGTIGIIGTGTLGWSEKHKSWKMQQFKADSEPRHSTDFRTIFGIMIGPFFLFEIVKA